MRSLLKGLFVFVCVLCSFFVYGLGSIVGASGVPYYVEPLLPDNQDEGVGSYISVTEEGRELRQEYKFRVTNISEDDISVDVSVVDAYTSPHGVIQYLREEPDFSRIVDSKYKLSNYLSGSGVVNLAKGETKEIKLSLDVEDIEGTLLGGVAFKTLGDEDTVEEGSSTFKINNEISMVVGVVVRFPTEKDVVFEVGNPYIDPMPAYYAVRLPIELQAPYLKKGVKLRYEVLDNEELVYEGDRELDISPRTLTDMLIPWESEEIEVDKEYIFKGTIGYEHGREEYEDEFEKVLKFGGKTVEEERRNSLEAPSVVKGSNIHYYVLGFVFILLVAGVVYFLRRKVNRKSIGVDKG